MTMLNLSKKSVTSFMKRISIVLPAVLSIYLLFGCSKLQVNRIETLVSWSFQYNNGTNDYSLFFGLLDQNDQSVSADVDVDIRIVNDAGEEVYSGTKSVVADDFSYYTSKAKGSEYLANVRIPAADIAEGKSLNGTVYLTVYKADTVSFDEVNCSASYCLPIQDIELVCEDIPIDLNVKDLYGKTESVIRIDDIRYSFEKNFSPKLTILIIGEKTYGTDRSLFDIISYKLYDSDGYVVDSGNVYLDNLGEGDKFKNDSLVIYDVTPGMTYVLRFSEYE